MWLSENSKLHMWLAFVARVRGSHRIPVERRCSSTSEVQQPALRGREPRTEPAGPSHNFHSFTNPRRRPSDEATSPALGPDLISLPAWGPLASHRQAVGTEHHCCSLTPEGLHPAGSSRLQRRVNKYLRSPLTVPRENTTQPQQALKPATRRAGSKRRGQARPGSPLTFACRHPPRSGPASSVYRSREIGQSLTIDFVPLLATAALDNSHRMDFSLNPQINICSGSNILLLEAAKPSGPTGLGIGGHMA